MREGPGHPYVSSLLVAKLLGVRRVREPRRDLDERLHLLGPVPGPGARAPTVAGALYDVSILISTPFTS